MVDPIAAVRSSRRESFYAEGKPAVLDLLAISSALPTTPASSKTAAIVALRWESNAARPAVRGPRVARGRDDRAPASVLTSLPLLAKMRLILRVLVRYRTLILLNSLTRRT
jgi:hypothetical protein